MDATYLHPSLFLPAHLHFAKLSFPKGLTEDVLAKSRLFPAGRTDGVVLTGEWSATTSTVNTAFTN